MEYFIGGALLAAVSFGSGFYLGQRGVAGVEIDLENAKKELKKAKDKINAKTKS